MRKDAILLPDISGINANLFDETVVGPMIPRDVIETVPGRDTTGTNQKIVLVPPHVALDAAIYGRRKRQGETRVNH